jgi:hypothetical protein
MRIDKLERFTVVIVLLQGLLAGCSTAACSAAFTNFLESHRREVGRSMDLRRPGLEGHLLSQATLPSGLIEYRYQYYRPTCTLIYEVNPKTRIIERNGFIGSVHECILPE